MPDMTPIWKRMDELMISYYDKIKKIKSNVESQFEDTSYKYGKGELSRIKKEKIEANIYALKPELISIFYKEEVKKYYTYIAIKKLGGGYDEYSVSDEYLDTIRYTIINFDKEICDSYSKYFLNIYIKRILNVVKDKKIETVSISDVDEEGISIEEKIGENDDDSVDIKESIDTLSRMLLFMKYTICIKKNRALKCDKIYNKIYTSDFCNVIYKTAGKNDYISPDLIKHEEELFDFMDIDFMDYFLVDTCRRIDDICKTNIKTEKEAGCSEENKQLKLPIEQRIYRIYYQMKYHMTEKDTESVADYFESYRKLLRNIVFKDHKAYKWADREDFVDYIVRYINEYHSNQRTKIKN